MFIRPTCIVLPPPVQLLTPLVRIMGGLDPNVVCYSETLVGKAGWLSSRLSISIIAEISRRIAFSPFELS